MTTYEKLKEALSDLDLTDAKHYAAELERENAKLREESAQKTAWIDEIFLRLGLPSGDMGALENDISTNADVGHFAEQMQRDNVRLRKALWNAQDHPKSPMSTSDITLALWDAWQAGQADAAANHEYAGELKAARDSNSKLREQLDSALIALEKIANYQGRFGEDDPQSVASDILSNAQDDSPRSRG